MHRRSVPFLSCGQKEACEYYMSCVSYFAARRIFFATIETPNQKLPIEEAKPADSTNKLPIEDSLTYSHGETLWAFSANFCKIPERSEAGVPVILLKFHITCSKKRIGAFISHMNEGELPRCFLKLAKFKKRSIIIFTKEENIKNCSPIVRAEKEKII